MPSPLLARRWHMVLDGLDRASAPFSTGPLVAGRPRLLAQPRDRRLWERTVEVAAASGACGARQGRAALERSPLGGAGRAEETSNGRGHALRQAVGVSARPQGRARPGGANEVGAPRVRGARLQAALDGDWAEPTARPHALPLVLDALQAVDHGRAPPPAPVAVAPEGAASGAVAHQGRAHEVTLPPDGPPTLRHGVAADRRMRVADRARRHGRQSRRRRIDGAKRQVVRDLDRGRMVAVGGPPGHGPEARVPEASATDLAAHQRPRTAWHLDRASLASTLVPQRSRAWAMFCQAWPVPQGPSVPKSALPLAWERRERPGPGGVGRPCEPGGAGTLPASTWAGGAWRARCPTSPAGRRVSLHPAEALWAEWRERQRTPPGRAKLRERVAVEHALAPIGPWQGRRARYGGVRKHGFDLRRCAVVHNVHVLARLTEPECQAA